MALKSVGSLESVGCVVARVVVARDVVAEHVDFVTHYGARHLCAAAAALGGVPSRGAAREFRGKRDKASCCS